MIRFYAVLAGFLLDCLLGDPHLLPHPVRLIGRTVERLEKCLRHFGRNDTGERRQKKQMAAGVILVAATLILTALVTAGILMSAYRIDWKIGFVAESIMCYYLLAAKSLQTESMAVCRALFDGDLEKARLRVSMIVGRDTQCLDEAGITRAAVETVAENTSDGVTAPLFYIALGGPVLGFIYKAVNTMDSMVGYKDSRYLYFGRAAAKLDDIFNFIPARLSAVLMTVSAYLLGFDSKNAWKIYKRDKHNHASPNSAQTESVCAGALCVRLAGNAVYFGKEVEKPYIGDPVREIETEDIKRADMLMYGTGLLMLIFMEAAGAFACFLIAHI